MLHQQAAPPLLIGMQMTPMWDQYRFYPRSLANFFQHDFLAPAFEIADDSSVTFTSVRNSVQASMTQNAFSSWSVEASAWVIFHSIVWISVLIRFLEVLEVLVDFLVVFRPREAVPPRISNRQPKKPHWTKSTYRIMYVYYYLNLREVLTASLDSSRA